MNVEILDEIFFEREISGFKAVDMFFEKHPQSFKYYLKFVDKVNQSREYYEISRSLNYLCPNIIYTFLSDDIDNKFILQENLDKEFQRPLPYYEFINIFIQLCFAFERMKEYVVYPFDFSNIKILEGYREFSFDIAKTKYTLRTSIVPVIKNFNNYTKDMSKKLSAMKSLFTGVVSYYNLINHETVTRVPLDEGGQILYDIFIKDFYNIDDNISPKEALKIMINKHRIIKDVFEDIVLYERKSEIENILTNPKIEYNRLTNSQNYREILDSCFPLGKDYLYLQYCIKILNTFPDCDDVRNKIYEINTYMIENNIKYSNEEKKIYDEIFQVQLVPLTPRYIPKLLKFSTNPEVMKTIGKGKIWEEKEWLEKVYRPNNWVILKQNKVVGYIALHGFFNFRNVLQLRVFIDPYSSGMGIGSTAVKLVLQQKINKLILGVVSADNQASQKMLEKAGMILINQKSYMVGLHYIYRF